MEVEKIILSGLAGSGKTTIGTLLAKKLNYKFYSLGNYVRDFSLKEYGMDINQFQELCRNDSKIDAKIDKDFSNYCNKTNRLVIDYRLGYLFIEKSFNVFLNVSEEEAVRRLCKANRGTEFSENTPEFVCKTMNSRNNKMKQRFLDFYNTDFTNPANYHLTVNTDDYSDFNAITDLIIKEFYNFSPKAEC